MCQICALLSWARTNYECFTLYQPLRRLSERRWRVLRSIRRANNGWQAAQCIFNSQPVRRTALSRPRYLAFEWLTGQKVARETVRTPSPRRPNYVSLFLRKYSILSSKDRLLVSSFQITIESRPPYSIFSPIFRSLATRNGQFSFWQWTHTRIGQCMCIRTYTCR